MAAMLAATTLVVPSVTAQEAATYVVAHTGGAGLEILYVPAGPAALIAAVDAATAVIVLDVRIPALDGVEMLAALRKNPACQAVPSIVLADSSSEQDIVRSFELGAEDYVVKPFSPAELQARIMRLMKRA